MCFLFIRKALDPRVSDLYTECLFFNTLLSSDQLCIKQCPVDLLISGTISILSIVNYSKELLPRSKMVYRSQSRLH